MAAVADHGRRRRPLVVAVCGSTGTGKSQLAVELAQHIARRRGVKVAAEVISADSMQMYRGMDVITNKATHEEMHGVPHHFLGVLDPKRGEECAVGAFVAQANEVIDEMHAREMVPIIAGGTNYYVQHLLLPGHLVSSTSHGPGTERIDLQHVVDACDVNLDAKQWSLLHRVAQMGEGHGSSDIKETLPALPQWELLRSLDPEMAARWHFRDVRKVLRSLRVLLTTGKRHSQWLAEQRERNGRTKVDNSSRGADGHAADHAEDIDRLVFWVYCGLDALRPRLNKRVDTMVDRGLLRELAEMRAIAKQLEHERGEPVDYTRGIFQTIGYKEFDAFMTHCEQGQAEKQDTYATLSSNAADERGRQMFDAALKAMKNATDKYAKRQVSWLRNTLAPDLIANERTHLVVLDGEDVGADAWTDNVIQPARTILNDFLDEVKALPCVGIALPVRACAPEQAPQHQSVGKGSAERQRLLGYDVCVICSHGKEQTPVMVMRAQWAIHERTRTHRLAMRQQGLLARQGPDSSPAAQAKRAARQARKQTPASSNDHTEEEAKSSSC